MTLQGCSWYHAHASRLLNGHRQATLDSDRVQVQGGDCGGQEIMVHAAFLRVPEKLQSAAVLGGKTVPRCNAFRWFQSKHDSHRM